MPCGKFSLQTAHMRALTLHDAGAPRCTALPSPLRVRIRWSELGRTHDLLPPSPPRLCRGRAAPPAMSRVVRRAHRPAEALWELPSAPFSRTLDPLHFPSPPPPPCSNLAAQRRPRCTRRTLAAQRHLEAFFSNRLPLISLYLSSRMAPYRCFVLCVLLLLAISSVEARHGPGERILWNNSGRRTLLGSTIAPVTAPPPPCVNTNSGNGNVVTGCGSAHALTSRRDKYSSFCAASLLTRDTATWYRRRYGKPELR